MNRTVPFVAATAIALAFAFAVSPPRSGAGGPPYLTYRNRRYGFVVRYPQTVAVATRFRGSYLVTKSWNVFADEATGRPLVSFRMARSDNVLSAEVHIGASRRQRQVASCRKLPAAAESRIVRLNGARFTSFIWRDAAMSHFVTVRGYRTVRYGVCFAIDELIYGTDPEVFDPPVRLPFPKAQARKVLDAIVKSFNFIRHSGPTTHAQCCREPGPASSRTQ